MNSAVCFRRNKSPLQTSWFYFPEVSEMCGSVRRQKAVFREEGWNRIFFCPLSEKACAPSYLLRHILCPAVSERRTVPCPTKETQAIRAEANMFPNKVLDVGLQRKISKELQVHSCALETAMRKSGLGLSKQRNGKLPK